MEFIYVRVLKTVQLRHIVCHSTVAHILFAHNAVDKIKQIILTYSYLVFFSSSRAQEPDIHLSSLCRSHLWQ